MNNSKTYGCAICGAERSSGQTRFLIAEDRWDDKVTILHWSEQMASRRGIQSACGVKHVEELVIHWMATGSLDHPFARTALGSGGWRRDSGAECRVDLSGGRPIGELAVHRESLERALEENPQSLQVILDALLDALQRESTSTSEAILERTGEEETELCAVSSEPEC